MYVGLQKVDLEQVKKKKKGELDQVEKKKGDSLCHPDSLVLPFTSPPQICLWDTYLPTYTKTWVATR